MTEHALCMDDDCPCFAAGEDSVRLELAEKSAELVEGMTRVVELLTPDDSGRSDATHNDGGEG